MKVEHHLEALIRQGMFEFGGKNLERPTPLGVLVLLHCLKSTCKSGLKFSQAADLISQHPTSQVAPPKAS